MIINTNINYGGRNSRLCYLVPLLVHTIFLYLVYLIYFNIEIINIYILLIFIIFVNLEWPLVIIYEYIYLTNYTIQNNLLYNIALLIFLEILLFIGFYWLYLNNIIHYPANIPFNNTISFNLLDHINHNNNTDICLYIILHNLLLLLYVTLILQLVHKYVSNASVNSNNHNNISRASCFSVLDRNIITFSFYFIFYYNYSINLIQKLTIIISSVGIVSRYNSSLFVGYILSIIIYSLSYYITIYNIFNSSYLLLC